MSGSGDPAAQPETAPLAVGLVGAGPWAGMTTAPMLAAGPETRLSAVWARRPEAAADLAARHGAAAATSFEDLLDRCDAVAFSVPPDVQAEIGVVAARAGKHLLLEKPLALDLEAARRLALAAAEASVITQVVLSTRYQRVTRDFLATEPGRDAAGATFVNIGGGSLPGGPFATPWRQQHGALLDVGPHVLDLLDAVLGPIDRVEGAGDPLRLFLLTARHSGGAVSQAAISIMLPVQERIWRFQVYGPDGVAELTHPPDDDVWATVRREFAHAVSMKQPHPLDVRRGLYLQELLAQAAAGH